MKTGKIEINGKTYPIAFTVRAAAACEERFGSIDKIGDAITRVSNIAWMLSTLIDCGIRNARAVGDAAPECGPSEDELLDTMSTQELQACVAEMARTISAGKTASVEAVPPKTAKNVKAEPRKR